MKFAQMQRIESALLHESMLTTHLSLKLGLLSPRVGLLPSPSFRRSSAEACISAHTAAFKGRVLLVKVEAGAHPEYACHASNADALDGDPPRVVTFALEPSRDGFVQLSCGLDVNTSPTARSHTAITTTVSLEECDEALSRTAQGDACLSEAFS